MSSEMHVIVFTYQCLVLSNSIQSTAPTCPPLSSNESILQLLTAFEKRQADRDALLYTKMERMEETLTSLSQRMALDHQSGGSFGTESYSQSTNEDCTQANGPSVQSLIEHGVCDGWSEYASRTSQ